VGDHSRDVYHKLCKSTFKSKYEGDISVSMFRSELKVVLYTDFVLSYYVSLRSGFRVVMSVTISA